MSFDALDARHMARALRLAERGLFTTDPNPRVGCVIADGERVLGEGFHAWAGGPHAEIEALRAAGGPVRGATAYVTLEPCSHHGRTPPCADGLAAAGIARVVAAAQDPDPRVNGRGFAKLRAAGIALEVGLMREEAERINEGFISLHERGRPHLTLKLAATLDARIATATGESRWISGEEARAWAHLLRAEHDAILVGMGTVRADDPALDCRLPGMADRSPLPVLLDPRLTLSAETRLVRSGRPLLVLHGPGLAPPPDLARPQIETEAVPLAPTGVDLRAALGVLGERGITRVLCEGGGRLAAALVAAGLVDEIAWVQAGLALGSEGRPAFGALPVSRLAEAPRFRLAGTRRLGADLATLWRPALAEGAAAV